MTENRVLIIDDDHEVRQAMTEFLKIEGFSTAAAANGAEGLDKMRSEDDVSVVLLDLWMPEMDGWEFLRQKKRDSRIADLPVVVLSSIPPVSLDGAEAILRKPVDIEPLLQILKGYCCEESNVHESVADRGSTGGLFMSDMVNQFEGGCLCGAVRFIATGLPNGTYWCHCQSCRKHTGAPASVVVEFNCDAYTITQG